MVTRRTANPGQCLRRLTLLVLVSAWSPVAAWASNSVVVESKTVPTGKIGATIEISIENDVPLAGLILPLEIRSTSGGAFWANIPSSIDTLAWHGRATSALTDDRGINKVDANGTSPDKIMIFGIRFSTLCLAPGPLQGMITLEFDVGPSPGQFEIDTTLVPPFNHLNFYDCAAFSGIVPQFTKGTITVVAAENVVAIESKTVTAGQTNATVEISLGNSEDLECITIPLAARSISGEAFWRNIPMGLDTLPWYGRLVGALTDSRSFDRSSADGISPDNIMIEALRTSGLCLSAGPTDGVIMMEFDVGHNAGQFIIDTAIYPPDAVLRFCECDVPTELTPSFVPGIITVSPGFNEVTIQSRTIAMGHSGTINVVIANGFEIAALSVPLVARTVSGGAFWANVYTTLDTLPWTGRLQGALTDIREFDRAGSDGVSPDEVRISASRQSSPCLGSGSPDTMISVQFTAGSATGNFEIDSALTAPGGGLKFWPCDGSPGVTPAFNKAMIYVLPFDAVALSSSGTDFSIATEDFDRDANLDFAIADLQSERARVFYGDGQGVFSPPEFLEQSLLGSDVVAAAFANGDPLPDIIGASGSTLHIHINNGARSFTHSTQSISPGLGLALGIATGYVNGDALLDLVVAGDERSVLFLGSSPGEFLNSGVTLPAANGVNLIDLNNDGYLDLILGQSTVSLFLGDGSGSFTLSDSRVVGNAYSIQSSSHGNAVDFDGDGNADFVLMFPRAGGIDSEVHVFFGDGAGHIESESIIPVQGNCYPVSVVDYDYDRNLDIAIGSSTIPGRIHLLLGDGGGGFAEPLSLSTEPSAPLALAVGDFREDGRWDFVVGSEVFNSAVMLNIDPPAEILDTRMTTYGLNEIQIRVTNPSGLSTDGLRNHIPGSRLGIRDVDSNSVLDQQIEALNIQPGEYSINVWRSHGVPALATYQLAIEVEGDQTRTLVRNASLPAAGDTVHFDFPIGPGYEVTPPTGSIAGSTTPTFDWSQVLNVLTSETDFTYELDLDFDPDFSSPEIHVSGLESSTWTPAAPLAPDTLYYWRFRLNESDGQCVCACHGDPACDSLIVDIVDVVSTINVAFRGIVQLPDTDCPKARSDVNCSGATDVVDVVKVVSVAFRGISATIGFCRPCESVGVYSSTFVVITPP